MQHVFIIGCKGIPAAYGGFETFAEGLITRQVNKNIQYHVACMDEKDGEEEYCGAHCFHIRVPAIGSARAVYYDLAALKYTIRYIREHRISHPIVYILACRIGPFIASYAKELHALGGKLYVNPDGHEWKRAKWSAPVRRYWKMSEKGMVKHADLLICDSQNIELYIRKDYRKFDPRTTYIAYGAEMKDLPQGEQKAEEASAKYETWLADNDLIRNGYYLVVGRMVPENNYETMISEFMASPTEHSLVFITDHKNNHFYEEIKNRTMHSVDSRIKFVGTVYDRELLAEIRSGAYAYLHGHEVGGTNPSLLEALHTTKLNLLLDVGFNREVAEQAALYWKKDSGNLAQLLDQADALSAEEREQYGKMAKERVKQAFSWDYIVEQYEDLFSPEIANRHCSVRRPMISVCMASYNGEKYIREQISSILNQLRYNDELVISDDGSSDNTVDIILEMEQEDSRIRFVKGPEEGIKQNIANALQHSSLMKANQAGFVFLADQDDVWMDNKVERILQAFEETDADLIVHDVLVTDEDCQKVIMDSYFEYRGSGAGALKNIVKNRYMGCAMAFRSNLLYDCLPIPDNIAMHDWWIGVRADLHGRKTIFLPDKLLKYRRHGNTVSDFEHNSIPIMIRNRLVFLHMLRKY